VFDSVALAKQVGVAGQTYPAVFNAANEQAVFAFHRGELAFLEILEVVREVVDAHTPLASTLETVLAAESQAREHADAVIARKSFR
jgi:1-deoxy-D-xylulose-5-phosphate reductoisomerase